MRQVRQILEYRLEKGISAEQTALALRVSKGTVINVGRRFEQARLAWPLPAEMTDSALETALYPPEEPPAEATAVALPDIQYLDAELRRPHVTLQRLWEEYHEARSDGLSRSAFYRFWRRHRPAEVTMHVIHKGGDKLFVDYSGDGLEYIERTTGEIHDVELFVCCWGASSYSYAEATMSQSIDDFIGSHNRSLAYFGAAPHAFVVDNLKSGVDKPDRYDPLANPMYEKMAQHYNAVVLPARIKKPRDKAVVESGVLHVQRFILARLRNRQFFSLAEINAAVDEELNVFNDLPMKDYGGQTRKQRFEELDKPYAQALPPRHFTMTRIKTDVRVAQNYHIRFEDHFYSVPHHLVGKNVEVHLSGNTLEIYHDGVHLCRHMRGMRKYAYTTVTQHMPTNHQFVKGWSAEWFRSKAGEVGPATRNAVDRIMREKQHVQQGFNAALGMLQLAKAFSPNRLERACERALHFNTVSYRSVKSILERNLDNQLLLPLQVAAPIVSHENIRGASYYTF